MSRSPVFSSRFRFGWLPVIAWLVTFVLYAAMSWSLAVSTSRRAVAPWSSWLFVALLGAVAVVSLVIVVRSWRDARAYARAAVSPMAVRSTPVRPLSAIGRAAVSASPGGARNDGRSGADSADASAAGDAVGAAGAAAAAGAVGLAASVAADRSEGRTADRLADRAEDRMADREEGRADVPSRDRAPVEPRSNLASLGSRPADADSFGTPALDAALPEGTPPAEPAPDVTSIEVASLEVIPLEFTRLDVTSDDDGPRDEALHDEALHDGALHDGAPYDEALPDEGPHDAASFEAPSDASASPPDDSSSGLGPAPKAPTIDDIATAGSTVAPPASGAGTDADPGDPLAAGRGPANAVERTADDWPGRFAGTDDERDAALTSSMPVPLEGAFEATPFEPPAFDPRGLESAAFEGGPFGGGSPRERVAAMLAALEAAGMLIPGEVPVDIAVEIVEDDDEVDAFGLDELFGVLEAIEATRSVGFERLVLYPTQGELARQQIIRFVEDAAQLAGQSDVLGAITVEGVGGGPVLAATPSAAGSANAAVRFELDGDWQEVPFVNLANSFPLGLVEGLATVFTDRLDGKVFVEAWSDRLVAIGCIDADRLVDLDAALAWDGATFEEVGPSLFRGDVIGSSGSPMLSGDGVDPAQPAAR